MQAFTDLEPTLGFTFQDKSLLQTAFVHRSFLNENPGFHLPSNERLEFLGDAVLELIVSEYLYRTYPDSQEGKLTSFRSSLVNTTSLAEVSVSLEVGKYLFFSRGEKPGDGRAKHYILANPLRQSLARYI